MGTELIVNADAFKKVGAPAKAFAAYKASEDKMGAGIAMGYGVISYKGKSWSLVKSGKRFDFLIQNGEFKGQPLPYLDVIILGYSDFMSKSYYRKYDPATSQGEKPICASIRGITPDPDVQHPQSQFCKTCPKNVFKTDENGRKFRECSDYKRLSVVILPPLTKPFFNGVPLVEPVFLRVPPASLKNLAELHTQMAEVQGFHHATYVTRISFDPKEPHPKMVFQALQPLTDSEEPFVRKLMENPMNKRITEGDIVLPDRDVTAAVTGGADVNEIAEHKSEPKPERVETGFEGMTDVPIVVSKNVGPTSINPNPAPVNAGSTSLNTGIEDAEYTEVEEEGASFDGAAAPGVGDGAEAMESTDDLDARIAGAISRASA